MSILLTVTSEAPTAEHFRCTGLFEAPDNAHVGRLITFQTGENAGFSRQVCYYDRQLDRLYVYPPFPYAPVAGDTAELGTLLPTPFSSLLFLVDYDAATQDSFLISGSNIPTVDGFYDGARVRFLTGRLRDLERRITAFDAENTAGLPELAFDSAWPVAPENRNVLAISGGDDS